VAILLASSAALAFGHHYERWQQGWYPELGVVDPRSLAGALGMVAGLVVIHRLWRRDALATFAVLAASVAGGVLSGLVYLSPPTMPRCGHPATVQSVVELGPLQRWWWWWNGLKFDETRRSRATTWMSDYCTELDVQPLSRKRVWYTKKLDQEGPLWGGTGTWRIHSVKVEEGRYLDGHEHGVWTRWHLNGRRRKQGRYEMGSPAGLWTWWHKNGVKLEQAHFVGGKREGPLTCWRPDGREFVSGLYCSGKPCGRWRLRDRLGQLTGGFPPDPEPERYSSLCRSLNFSTVYDMVP
jgi:hypothetical protein